jgi:hypothetical protein
MVTSATQLVRYVDGRSLIFIDNDTSDMFTTSFNIQACYSTPGTYHGYVSRLFRRGSRALTAARQIMGGCICRK